MLIEVSTVYLFMALVATGTTGKVGYMELYRTTDKAACEAHMTEWNAKLTPNKFACVTLDTGRMKSPHADD